MNTQENSVEFVARYVIRSSKDYIKHILRLCMKN